MTDQPPNNPFHTSSFLQGRNTKYLEKSVARSAGLSEAKFEVIG